jgi:short-subunit dehydrogenase
MNEMKELSFITGAASGIGRAFALALAKRGMKLFITDINVEDLEKVKLEIEKTGGKVFASKCDVAKIEDFENAAEDFYSKLGDVDLLINNAGIAIGGDLADIVLEDWKKVIDINLWSVIHSLKAFLPRMLEKGSGHIVNVASTAGITGSPEPLPYITSKFAVVGLSEALYGRLNSLGINVSVILPLIIKTNIWNINSTDVKYPSRLLKDYDKEKLNEVYGGVIDEILTIGISPDLAVKKYIRGIKKNKLYIFDTKALVDLLALKGNDLQQYEKFLLESHENRAKQRREHFRKHGINIDDYI